MISYYYAENPLWSLPINIDPSLRELASSASGAGAAGITYYNAEANDDYFDADADRSYSFGFTSDEHNRDEAADSAGQISGSYSYVDASGATRSLTYTAGAGLGFVPVGNFLPVNPEVDAARAAHAAAVKNAPKESTASASASQVGFEL